jgi:hypothetical protein
MPPEVVLPPEIVVTEWPGGIRYRLPPQQLGTFRWFGLLVAAFGLAPIAMVFSFVGFALKMAGNNPGMLIGLLCPLPVLLSFVGIGGLFMFFGVWILAGHGEIELTPTKIRVHYGYRPVSPVTPPAASAGSTVHRRTPSIGSRANRSRRHPNGLAQASGGVCRYESALPSGGLSGGTAGGPRGRAFTTDSSAAE